jgi:undecaprenyl-diphosphatase
VIRIVATFAAVLALGVLIGLALRPFIAPVGSTTMDRHVTDWFFTWRTPRGLTNATRISWLGGPIGVIPITAATFVGLAAVRRWRLDVCFVVIVSGAAALNALARVIVDPRRPPGELGLHHPFASSFPSGHAAEASAVFVGLGLIVFAVSRARAARVLVWPPVAAVIFVVGAARVYLAVHWTTDVLTGVVIGTTWALGTARAFGLHAPRAHSAPTHQVPDASRPRGPGR